MVSFARSITTISYHQQRRIYINFRKSLLSDKRTKKRNNSLFDVTMDLMKEEKFVSLLDITLLNRLSTVIDEGGCWFI